MSVTSRWPWPVVLNLGMGVDSVATLTRWVHEPDSRNFDLGQLVIVTSMTGDEHDDTAQAMTDHVLPLMRSYGLRYAQISRAGQSASAGIAVLSDTRRPTRMHMRGPWALSDELAASGTLPPVARRACSQRAKGDVIDRWLADRFADIPYLHVKGYRLDEPDRIAADTRPARPERHPDYPLARWGWRRPEAQEYLQRIYHRPWPRSCCTFCPFQSSRSGIGELIARWSALPAGAVQALILERVAIALNPRQQLFATRSAYEVVAAHPQLAEAAALAEHQLDQMPWAVYDVRRIYHARGGDPASKGHAWRSVRRLVTVDRTDADEALAAYAQLDHVPVAVDEHGIPRAWYHRAGQTYPTVERYLTVAPAEAADKERPQFARTWLQLTAA